MIRAAQLFVLVVGCSAIALLSFAAPRLDSTPLPPAPPRLLADELYPTPTGRGIRVRASGNFQAALDTAQPGDVISLEAGAVYRGNFILRKNSRPAWIVIQSSTTAPVLPLSDVRALSMSASGMPKLITPNDAPVVQTAPGARGYRFSGIEFTIADNVRTTRQIIAFGGTQTSLSETPSDLILDRCYVHGHALADVFRGVLLNSASSTIQNSYISDIHVAGHDSQAILGYNGPGPFKIVNNYLEAAGENIMFGGGDPSIPNLIPSDIEIRNNHLFKPLQWRDDKPGRRWTVKNLLELKNAQRVLITGNILENAWPDAQAGTAVVWTPRNHGAAPWAVVQDVLFRDNVVKNAVGGVGMQASDDERPSQPLRRVAVVNNLWVSIERSFLTLAVPAAPAEDIVVDHNTAIPTRYLSFDLDASAVPAVRRFQFTNNLIGFGVYGVKFPNSKVDVDRMMPGATIASNALVLDRNLTSMAKAADGERSKAGVRKSFVLSDASAAGLNGDGTLTSRSPLRAAGTDGKDIGVDFRLLYHRGPAR